MFCCSLKAFQALEANDVPQYKEATKNIMSKKPVLWPLTQHLKRANHRRTL